VNRIEIAIAAEADDPALKERMAEAATKAAEELGPVYRCWLKEGEWGRFGATAVRAKE
jgi:hypothetical protein